MALGGGGQGIRDIQALLSSVAQPRMTFGGRHLYVGVIEKAAALGFSLIENHPFIDGNKRVGHAAMETFLVLNGYEIQACIEEQEDVILRVAAGEMSRAAFVTWLHAHVVRRK